MARRVIRKFALKYIAGVDRPAVVGATVRIMKRADGAHIGDTKLDYSKIDLGALADVVLEGATTALLKAEPALSREQAFAKVYSNPKYRLVAEAEREASAKRLLAGVPVARTAATILNDLSDESIIALVQEIRDEHPFVSDAELVRMIASSAEERAGRAAVRANVRQATREGSRVPQPSDTLSSRSSDDGVRKHDALIELNARADELRKADPSLSAAMAFSKAYLDPLIPVPADADSRGDSRIG